MTYYFGENICTATYKNGSKKGESCANNAYYIQDNKILCGVHSHIKKRQKLPKNPNADIIREKDLKQKQELVEEKAEENRKNKQKGHVICSAIKMMKPPPHYDGYLKVFPNYKHQNRKDGFGCMKLSPKSLGPIKHGMPNLPIAKNLENYHQASKIFDGEIIDNKITNVSFNIRKEIYNSDIPYRHKFEHLKLKKIINNIGKNKNIPLFSVYYDSKGKEHRYNYIQCRYFYCHYYEILAPLEKDFVYLKKLIDSGYNLQIIGYDAFDINQSLMEHYLDTSRPFGHELVLYTLLTVNNKQDYPWNIYYQDNKDIYEGVISS
jgi:hypothetical protein